ncbi:LysE family translocator [Acinetobacter baumannii]|uniref:LysE family translocator n=1 Tax=Acinetobacter baumannii TaxID=470 RepID=UPI0022EAB57E|nr:LysE family translocator [Acinetobacter baumannii]MDA3481721.1 LysE family translocator [Acinetobacter baumannii]WGT83151.1 LysE family translocator [Acinetobacter baumannii]HEO1775705.1 LysE family translocator [Acinetobacter baumannii]
MSGLLVFITIAFLTLSSPGPGVLFTVTNSINYGVRTALFGIIGLIIGMFVIAVISASGVGLIITSNPTIFTVLKFIGAFYLMYLGYKNFVKTSPSQDLLDTEASEKTVRKSKLFYQGLFASLLNPKTIVFFIALFPQFIDIKEKIINQFLVLSLTFCLIGFLIHLVYANFSSIFKEKMLSGNNFARLNKISGCIFFILAVLLIVQ